MRIHLAFAICCGAFGSLVGSCSNEPTAYEQCLQAEAAGQSPFIKKNDCGCTHTVCSDLEECLNGECCNPSHHMANPKKCGCVEVCAEGWLCQGGACCNPTLAGSDQNCGCGGPCKAHEKCVPSSPNGPFVCECDPDKAGWENSDCGCSGETCYDPEVCSYGVCECDPSKTKALSDSSNCGCRGPCPANSYCKNAVCVCNNPSEIVCDGSCISEDDCFCEPDKHQADVTNCNCQGPCPAGDKCAGGQCECDPAANSVNTSNCNCAGPCPGDYVCSGGQCICAPENLANAQNCGCTGPCPPSYACSGGTCICPPENLSNSQNCGCAGPCPPGEKCLGGSCGCPVENLNNAQNCACKGPCPEGFICNGGVCTCAPENFSNPENCGCEGPCPDISGGPYACQGGVCVCPPDKHLCIAAANLEGEPLMKKVDQACRPLKEYTCSNCGTFCNNGPCKSFDNDNDGFTDAYECP